MPVYKYNLSAFYNVQEGHYIFVFLNQIMIIAWAVLFV